MELQIIQFWILKEHSSITSANEYEPDVIEFFLCKTGLKTRRMYEIISAFATQKVSNFTVY